MIELSAYLVCVDKIVTKGAYTTLHKQKCLRAIFVTAHLTKTVPVLLMLECDVIY